MAVICGVWAPGENVEYQTRILAEMTGELEGTVLEGVAFQLDDNIRLHCFEHPRLLPNPAPSDFFCRTDGDGCFFGEMRLFNREALADQIVWNADKDNDLSLIALLLSEQGEQAIGDVEGDFCLARYIPGQEELTFFRDIIGHKSYFYAFTDFGLAFSSIVQPVYATPDLEPKLSLEALAACVVLSHPGKGTTCFDNISEVPAASSCKVSPRKILDCDRFWQPKPDPASNILSESEKIEELKGRLVTAVGSRLPQGRAPVGVQLSGGLDSSTIAGVAASLTGYTKMFAISHVLPEGKTSDVGDETQYIKSVLTKWPDIEWAPVSDDGETLLQAGEEWQKWFCCPDPDCFHNINQRIFEEADAHGITVLFSGLGGDECVSAWGTSALSEFVLSFQLRRAIRELRRLTRRHPKVNIARLLRSRLVAPVLPKFLRSYLYRLRQQHWSDDYLLSREMAASSELDERLRANHFKPSSVAQTKMSKWEIDNLKQLDLYHLPAMDFMANLSGFQLRYPLLDRRLIEFAIGLPASLKVSNDHDRMLLRLAGAGYLPGKILERQDKLPFYPDFPKHVSNNESEVAEALDAASSLPAWKTLIGETYIAKHQQESARNSDHFTTTYDPSLKLMQLYSLAAFLTKGTNKGGRQTPRM